MADDPKDVTPPKDPVKPEDKPDDQVDDEVKDKDLEGNDDNLTISKIGYQAMQKTILKLEKEANEAKEKAGEAERLSVYNELLALSPNLAKLNKKSSKERLEGALEAAKEQKEGFPSLKDDKKDPVKASYADHDSQTYDFVKKEYVFN